MSWTPDSEWNWQRMPESVKKIITGLPSTAKVLVQHLIALEGDVRKHEKTIQVATKSIQNNRSKQAKTLDEITELKQILVSTYKLNIDTMRVIEKL